MRRWSRTGHGGTGQDRAGQDGAEQGGAGHGGAGHGGTGPIAVRTWLPVQVRPVPLRVRPAARAPLAVRTAGRLAGVVALAALAAGCGIRTTSVPVDAGPAPSRMPCEIAGKDVITQSESGVPVRVYLVCASGLASVERAAGIPAGGSAGDRLGAAQALLDELQAEPSTAEREAGFTTSVRGPLVVSAAHAGDPAGALRLSRQPEDLPAAALAQIVCTFAEGVATDGRVALGGPGSYATRTYGCDQDTKRHPDADLPTLAPSTGAAP
ncbi:hypothetical protein ACFXKG_28205 [Streptomyces sp. NPDC059255]|uniref:hypothetical protein n=1 Tax=Streptomyces sp. NPDC059255 TaxID=3346793 RepID=UPI00367614E4